MDGVDLTKLTPRPYQREVLDIVFGKKAGENKWYIVSPPGSGKTILGLMVALKMQTPTLVFAPNTAIQMQWVAKSRMFLAEDARDVASITPDDDLPITVLTYQALARPEQFSDEQKDELIREWLMELTGEGVEEAGDPEERTGDVMDESSAERWLSDFEQQNQERFETALLRRWKRRRLSVDHVSSDSLMNDSARAFMRRLTDKGVGLIIFDECHHLVGYWAQVALALKSELPGARVLGFTATPPAAKQLSNTEIALHKQLLDEIDYFVPTPAVVKDGNLAPYQDLVYFTRPLDGELAYIRGCSERLNDVLGSAEAETGPTLSNWLLDEMRAVPDERLASALRHREKFFTNGANYLRLTGKSVPPRFAHLEERPIDMDERVDLVGRFAAHTLLISSNKVERQRFEALARVLRPLGFILSDTGARRCQSTVGRVLALSESKMKGLVELLSAEIDSGGDEIRAVVICDFEKSSATVDKEISHLLTSESGGAVAAMRALTANAKTDGLDPILVTGKTVMVDDDLLPVFIDAMTGWFETRGLATEINSTGESGFYRIDGSGKDWNVRTYVAMITEFLERGLTRCLVGTRGLLGEGWDSLTVNTLVDLTIAATEMTVNQLRGRAIRLNPAEPRKVANIWDVVCLAPEFEKGLTDYHRLVRKHSHYYGVCDDGEIEYGLGHIHPALKEVGPEDVAMNAHVLNAEMVARCTDRPRIYGQWKVGEPYTNKRVPSLDIHAEGAFGQFGTRGGKLYDIKARELLMNMSLAVVKALSGIGAFEDPEADLDISERADGYYRIRMNTGSEHDMNLMAVSIRELFDPIADQRYIIPRSECNLQHNWFTRLLPEVLHRYVCRKRESIAIYHPVPGALGDSKKHAEEFRRKWNEYVSPGKAVYTKRGEGEEILMRARPRSQSVMTARAKLKSVWR